MEGIHGGWMAEKRLYDAAAKGDARAYRELLQEDPLLLERVSFTCRSKTPLHIAAMKGHLELVQEILNCNPQLAEDLDSQQSSALHLASARGNEEIVRELVSAAPDMCLSHDCQGRTPLHLAIMKGHIRVLEFLIGKNPLAAREKIDRGLTPLHFCVKHHKLDALKILVQQFNELLNAKDDDGDTVLHMTVRNKQIEIIEYLVRSTKIDMDAKNRNGQTASDISEEIFLPDTENSSIEIPKILKSGLSNPSNQNQTRPQKWLTKKRDAIMVVAVLIATMAFQAGVNPAGGVWQDDLTEDSQGNPIPSPPHRAGEAVMAYNHPKSYRNFMRANTTALVSSLSTILLLISGLPFRRRLFMWFLMVIMWLTVTSIAVTYGISVVAVTPRKDRKSLTHVMEISISVWCGVMGILLVGNTVRLLDRWLKNRGITVWRPRRFRSLGEVNCVNSAAGKENV